MFFGSLACQREYHVPGFSDDILRWSLSLSKGRKKRSLPAAHFAQQSGGEGGVFAFYPSTSSGTYPDEHIYFPSTSSGTDGQEGVMFLPFDKHQGPMGKWVLSFYRSPSSGINKNHPCILPLMMAPQYSLGSTWRLS